MKVTLTTPHRPNVNLIGMGVKTLKDILTPAEKSALDLRDWLAFREVTGERITLETPLQNGDSITLRVPSSADWARYCAELPEPPRAYTEKEVSEKFIQHVWTLIDYWETVEGPKTMRDRLSGLTHSIFATFDGCSAGLPAFKVTPSPHKNDKAYHEEHGENWFPDDIDIGSLHDALFRHKPRTS